MTVRDRLHHLTEVTLRERFREDPLARQDVGQVPTVGVLHYDVQFGRRLKHIQHPNDIRMLHRLEALYLPYIYTSMAYISIEAELSLEMPSRCCAMIMTRL